jgi:hypothetical protein
VGAAVSPAIRTPAHPATAPSRIRHAHRAAGPPGLPADHGRHPCGPAGPHPRDQRSRRPRDQRSQRPCGPSAPATSGPGAYATCGPLPPAGTRTRRAFAHRVRRACAHSVRAPREHSRAVGAHLAHRTPHHRVPGSGPHHRVPGSGPHHRVPGPGLTTACPVRASARGPRRGGPVPAGGPASAGRAVTVPTVVEWCRCRGSRTAARHRARRDRASAPEFAGVRPPPASGDADGPRLLPGAVLSVGWVVPEAVTGYGAPSHRTPAPCVTTP